MLDATEPSLARTAARLAGIGAVGAVGAMLAAPLAHAEPATPAASSTTLSGAGSNSASTSTSPSRAITPSYGVQKVRVGIAVKSGAVVAPGTVLSGAQLRVVTSAVGAPFNVPETTATCDTGPDGFCDTSFGQSDSDGQLTLLPGQTAELTQVSAPAGLVVSTETLTQQPCTTDCSTNPPATLVLQDTGPRPTAGDDTASVAAGGTVNIKVLDNDSGHGGADHLDHRHHPGTRHRHHHDVRRDLPREGRLQRHRHLQLHHHYRQRLGHRERHRHRRGRRRV